MAVVSDLKNSFHLEKLELQSKIQQLEQKLSLSSQKSEQLMLQLTVSSQDRDSEVMKLRKDLQTRDKEFQEFFDTDYKQLQTKAQSASDQVAILESKLAKAS